VTLVRLNGEAILISMPLWRFLERWQRGLATHAFIKAWRMDNGRRILINPHAVIYARTPES
jgi:hypothetical protein